MIKRLEGIKIGVVSLGCCKNRVDSENMMALLKEEGAEFVSEYEGADVAIVNTCGFIDDAKQESINEILTAAEYKDKGLKALIVTGCLSQRYNEELAAELYEADAFLGVASYEDIVEAVLNALENKRYLNFEKKEDKFDYKNRVMTTPGFYTYIKIAEGCDNRCSYCAIPYIRGRYKSRDIKDIIEETKHFVKRGVQEFIVVAQDTTRYGKDLYGKPSLCELLRQMNDIEGDFKIRILYSYPEMITKELAETMATLDKVVNYVDMPIQHTCDRVLKKMYRRGMYEDIKRAVETLRAAGDFVIRSTVIAGFPTETEEEHQLNLQRIKELGFDRLGAFAYSQEEGTPAALFEGQLEEETKKRRRDEIFAVQQEISFKKNQERIGKEYDVIIEGTDGEVFFGRSWAEAPDVDGKILIKCDELMIGQTVKCRITHADEYDLLGEII